MYTTPKIPALNPKLNYDNIVRLAFTHQQNRGKSIRAIARQRGMNPGTVYRILKRLGLVIPEPRQRQHSKPCISNAVSHSAPQSGMDSARCPEHPQPPALPVTTGLSADNTHCFDSTLSLFEKIRKNVATETYETPEHGSEPVDIPDLPPEIQEEMSPVIEGPLQHSLLNHMLDRTDYLDEYPDLGDD